METKFLLLWLEAPLQSWGADSKYGRRDSLPFPTRSGVLGLILCAMGASGEQKELLAQFGALGQAVYAYRRRGCERESLLCDFHMVGSGYNDKDAWQTFLIPKTAEGKKAVGGGTKMTYRYYLQDAYFAVVLPVPEDLAANIASSLQNPVYDVYLGRKNCVPSDLIFRGIFSSELDAKNECSHIAEIKQLDLDFSVIDGDNPEKGDVITLNDIPLQFGMVKKYRDRRITVIPA